MAPGDSFLGAHRIKLYVSVSCLYPHALDPENNTFITDAQAYQPSRFSSFATSRAFMPNGNSRMRRSHASTIRFSTLLARTVFAHPTLRPILRNRPKLDRRLSTIEPVTNWASTASFRPRARTGNASDV
jgi:hypothetical protein